MVQLQLLDLMIQTEKVAVPMDGTTRTNLIDLMASILMAVFDGFCQKFYERAMRGEQDTQQ